VRRYKLILQIPGALGFSASGFMARLPSAGVGIGIVLMVSGVYGGYGLAGAISATFVICQALGSPIVARLADRHGQHRVVIPAVMVSSLMLLALAFMAWAGLPEWALFAPAGLCGVSYVSFGPMVRARWTRVLTKPGGVHTAFSLESALDELTFVISPALITVLATTWSPYIGVVGPVVLLVPAAIWFVSQKSTEPPPVPRPTAADAGSKPARERSVLWMPGMLAVTGTFVAMGALFGGFDVSAVAYADEAGAKSQASILLVCFSISSCAAGFFYGARNWTSPLWKRFVLGVTIVTVGTALFVVAPSITVLSIMTLVVGAAIAPTMITGNALVQRLVPAARLTEGLTWVSSSLNVGVSIGSAVVGQVVDRMGAHYGFWTLAVFAVFGAALTFGSAHALRRITKERGPGGTGH
jgi:predicted MFS family arabinose efflux permease